METLLDAKEVAALLKISRRKFEMMLKEGSGPTYMRLGGLRRWRLEDIKAWSDKKVREREESDRQFQG